MKIEGTSDIREIEVMGDRAYVRAYLEVALTPAEGPPVHRRGYTLSIFRKGADGRWRIARDANLLVKSE